jgi:excinuclease ABC subunit C
MTIDLSQVPQKPGVYLFKASGDRIIYIGKAKNLKNRLRSYSHASSGLDARKSSMVEEIRDFSYIATDNELEAWILEASLIKQHRPKFNIVLRDDKNYPYIRITVTEEWPRVEVVRKIARDGNLYFGPYIPAQAMWEAIDFIRRNFLVRTCSHTLDKPVKPCIQHQMKRCLAPCSGDISAKEYRKIIDDIILFLKGEKKGLLKQLEKKMSGFSRDMKYEEAAQIRDRIARLQKAFESQKMIAPELGDLDVIGFYREESGSAAFSTHFIRNGVMIGARDYFVDDRLGSEDSEVFSSFIERFYSKEIFPADVILTSLVPSEKQPLLAWLERVKGRRVKIIVPKEGKKRELLLMANENARFHFLSRGKVFRDEIMSELASAFGLERQPVTIAAFDVSTLSGSDSVGAMIWWENGAFSKEFYRHLKIKLTEGMDDYAMLYETIVRTLNNLDGQIPDLIVVDGGKGQLDMAVKALRNSGVDTAILGVAKKPDRAFLRDGRVIALEGRDRAFLLLKQLRDEVHRFVIGFHRRLRDKRLMESQLEKVPGIGKSRRLGLLKQFGSIDNIRKASPDEIAQIKGFTISLAEDLLRRIQNNED